MRDARISTTLPSHPKTKKLIKRRGAEGAWALVCLILWTAANRSDGDLVGMTDEDIELAANWAGAEGELVLALVEVGFLDGQTGAYSVHDWAEHNPWAASANDRSESARWAALVRRYGQSGAAERMPDYAGRMRPACDPQSDALRPLCPVSVSVSDTVSDTASVSSAEPKGLKDSKKIISASSQTLKNEKPKSREQIKAIWQSNICREAQATMTPEKYAVFVEAWANDDPGAKRIAEQLDRQIKARKSHGQQVQA